MEPSIALIVVLFREINFSPFFYLLARFMIYNIISGRNTFLLPIEFLGMDPK